MIQFSSFVSSVAFLLTFSLCASQLQAQSPSRPSLKSPREALDEASGFGLEEEEKAGLIDVEVEASEVDSPVRIIRVQATEDPEEKANNKKAMELLKVANERLQNTISYIEQKAREGAVQEKRRTEHAVRQHQEIAAREAERAKQEVSQLLRREAENLHRRLAELREKYGEQHPTVQRDRKILEQIEQKIRQAEATDRHRKPEHDSGPESERRAREIHNIARRQAEVAMAIVKSKSDAERKELKEIHERLSREIAELRRGLQQEMEHIAEHLRDEIAEHSAEVRRRQHEVHEDHDDLPGHHHDPRQHEIPHHEDHPAIRDHDGPGEHNPHADQMERVHALHEAAERLERSGLHDMAHELHRRADEIEQSIHRPHNHAPETDALLHELLENVGQLRREVRELNEKVDRILHRPMQSTGEAHVIIDRSDSKEPRVIKRSFRIEGHPGKIHGEANGGGVGARLIEVIEDKLKAAGSDDIEVEVRVDAVRVEGSGDSDLSEEADAEPEAVTTEETDE